MIVLKNKTCIAHATLVTTLMAKNTKAFLISCKEHPICMKSVVYLYNDKCQSRTNMLDNVCRLCMLQEILEQQHSYSQELELTACTM